ncbi:MAG: HD domain-containing protein [Christensenellales bacterium]|jgi:uncharacterized protein
MNRQEFVRIEEKMLETMDDSAHDKEHVYRVLYNALDIAAHESKEKAVDYDVLIAACLLHDIGRREQYENPALCHAAVGAEKAYAWLKSEGYENSFAEKVRDCIAAHRFRGKNRPQSVEGKILFDADKLDVAGAIGIARTFLYQGETKEPIYNVDENGGVLDGSGDESDSFFYEYKRKLENISEKMLTARGREMAIERKPAAAAFYDALLEEVDQGRREGKAVLQNILK